MGQKSSARPPDSESLKSAGKMPKPDAETMRPANGFLRPNGRILKADAGILKKEILGYTGICLVFFILLGAGGMLARTFPVRALLNTLLYLAVGGLGISVWIFYFHPETERSEFFKTFRWLYHPGIWMLAAASFLENSDILPEKIAANLHLAYIAGWTFLVAGVIVLIVILREGKT